ncbi:MAG: hypothetical protein ACREIQ_04570, partial [Nitrospiria bacterium]
MLGGLRRCSIFLIDDDQASGFLKDGFDLRDTNYPTSGIKIFLRDCPRLEQCVIERQAVLLKRPFDDGFPVLWEEIPNKEKISAIGMIPFFND